jgi:DNA topoisomerase I
LVRHLKTKWSTFNHNGIFFPPSYTPRYLSITIRGKKLSLSFEQEEMLWAVAKKRDTPYVKDPVFTSNFTHDFAKILTAEHHDLRYDELDLSEFARLQEEEKNRVVDKESKKKLAALRKAAREELREKYGHAEMDCQIVDISNWMAEPPGIFMGRGAHPLRGRWKPRIHPEDVTLNLGENVKIPEGNWSGVVHDHESMWVARWIDKLTEKEKYVWLSESSNIRQLRERAKFDKAARLDKNIGKVREYVTKGMTAKDEETRKVATVCYLIDRLAMRVGDEKDAEEADTVGASTLRYEHVKLKPSSMEFDFLGKDSVRWQKNIEIKDDSDKTALINFQAFLKEKKEGDLIFDGIRSVNVNRFLGKSYPGLTAKVFRTFLATNVVRKYLQGYGKFQDLSDYMKIYYVKMANLQAAIMCNHKRTPPKNWEASLAKKEERLEQLLHHEAKTEKTKMRLENRIRKMENTIKLAKATKDYNLNTSLKNYIDPRVFKNWSDEAKLDWKLICPLTLQKKFGWVEKERVRNESKKKIVF